MDIQSNNTDTTLVAFSQTEPIIYPNLETKWACEKVKLFPKDNSFTRGDIKGKFHSYIEQYRKSEIFTLLQAGFLNIDWNFVYDIYRGIK